MLRFAVVAPGSVLTERRRSAVGEKAASLDLVIAQTCVIAPNILALLLD